MARSSEEKKEMIIKNFLDLVRDHGINRVTLNDVAEKSGLTKSALYYYFDSKETLLVEGFDFFNDKIKNIFIPLVEKADTPVEIIKTYIDFNIKVHTGEYEEFRHMMEMTTEVFYEIQRYIFNSPEIAKKILQHRDTELWWINSIIAEYIGENPEDDRTKKIALVFAAHLHSYIHISCQMSKQMKNLSTTYSILTDFPWKIDNVTNEDICTFLIGGINNLYKLLFNK
jgi:AcrR family transcriptional regulator